ncbi:MULTISPECIES: hypothetical protein [Bacillales]|uniref:hypothetical protein n=1 Tax=Bacillales TaxID=1385 RepID=UPI000346D070|nr:MULTISPECIES: hypothetical protein [Bacillales]KMZ42639.1 hypothetical protein AC624_16795 [Bacillus sp. FJAT-27238]
MPENKLITTTSQNQLSNVSQNHLSNTTGFQSYLKELGLPSENILAPDHERAMLQISLPMVIENIPSTSKKDAIYLSKFVAASAIGLYDAALNYLWNEVIVSLREKVKLYGIDLFFDVAVGGELRETYTSEEDLSLIKDVVLIDSCFKLELISPILQEKLKHILFMRNHIGASHPTDETINTHELLGWLQICVNQVIAETPSEAAIYVSQLIVNLKRDSLTIDDATVKHFSRVIQQQNRTFNGNLLVSIFGVYIKKNTSSVVRGNILKLAPIVWDASSEQKKYEVAMRYDKFSLNLDEESKLLTNSFLEVCKGLNYKSEGIRVSEIDSLLDELLDNHHSYNNFHKEVPTARELAKYIKNETDILPNFEEKLIETILICRLGNGTWYNDGVSLGAKGYYDDFLKLLNAKHVNKLLKILNNSCSSQLHSGNCRLQLKHILNLINFDLQEPRTRECLELIRENLDSARENIFKIKDVKECMKFIS